MTDDRRYTMAEAKDKLGLSVSTVRYRSALLDRPPMRVGRQKERLFTLEQIEEMRRMKQAD